MQFKIKNNYPDNHPDRISFQALIDSLNDEENQTDQRWEDAKEAIQFFVEQHELGVQNLVRTTKGTFIPMPFTELERLGKLYYFAHMSWNYCLIGHDDYTKIATRMYKECHPDIQEKVKPIIELFALWGWG